MRDLATDTRQNRGAQSGAAILWVVMSSLIQEKDTYFGNSTAAPTEPLAFTAFNVTVNDLIVVEVGWEQGITISQVTDTFGSGYTPLPLIVGSTTHQAQFFYANAVGSGPCTVTVHFTGAGGKFVQITMAEYAPTIGNIFGIDVHNEAIGTSITPTSPSVATSAGNELWIGYGDTASGITWTAGTGWTPRSTSGLRSFFEDQINVAQGNAQAIFNITNGSNAWTCGVATFKLIPPAILDVALVY